MYWCISCLFPCFYLTKMNTPCIWCTSLATQHRFSLTLTLRADKKSYFTSSGSSLLCLHFPIVLRQCHPAVKPFGGEEDERAGLRSVWGWHGRTERVLAPLTALFLLWRGHQGFGGICCSPWQDGDGALTMEVADQDLVQGTLGGFFLRHGSWVTMGCSYDRQYLNQSKSVPIHLMCVSYIQTLLGKGSYLQEAMFSKGVFIFIWSSSSSSYDGIKMCRYLLLCAA